MELATETMKKSRPLPSYNCVTTTPERRPRGLTPSALPPKLRYRLVDISSRAAITAFV